MKDLLPLLLSKRKKGIEEEFYCADVKADSSHHICMDVRALWADLLETETLQNCCLCRGKIPATAHRYHATL